jgi:hypothetical protein
LQCIDQLVELFVAHETAHGAIVDQQHGCISASTLAFALLQSDESVGGGLAGLNTQSLLQMGQGLLAAAQMARQIGANIQFSINQVLKASLSSTGFVVNNVNINSDTVTNTTNNLILTATNNNVQVSAVLNLDDQISTPASVSGRTKMYSSSVLGPGRTGVYVTNNTITTPDELISRNRAVLLSILL